SVEANAQTSDIWTKEACTSKAVPQVTREETTRILTRSERSSSSSADCPMNASSRPARRQFSQCLTSRLICCDSLQFLLCFYGKTSSSPPGCNEVNRLA